MANLMSRILKLAKKKDKSPSTLHRRKRGIGGKVEEDFIDVTPKNKRIGSKVDSDTPLEISGKKAGEGGNKKKIAAALGVGGAASSERGSEETSDLLSEDKLPDSISEIRSMLNEDEGKRDSDTVQDKLKSPKKVAEDKKEEEDPTVPGPNQVKDRKNVQTIANNINNTKVPEDDGLKAELKSGILADRKIVKEVEDEKKKLESAYQDALDDYKKTKDSTQWASIAEKIGHALTQLGAGAYGMKHGVDMSGVKFDKTDWQPAMDSAMDDLNLAKGRRDDNLKRGTEAGASVLSKLSALRQMETEETREKTRKTEREEDRELKREEMGAKKRALEEKELQKNVERLEKGIKDNAKLEDSLRKEWKSSPVTKDTQKLASQFEKMQGVFEGEPSPAGDLAFVFTYMKILDPTSVVREGEQALAIKSAKISDRVWEAYKKVKDGLKLTTSQRKDFYSQAKGMYKSQLKVQSTVDKHLLSVTKRRGLNTTNVVDKGLYQLLDREAPAETSESDKTPPSTKSDWTPEKQARLDELLKKQGSK